MRTHHKHLHLARRKMGHILDELYTALLHCGSEEVDIRIVRETDGLRLFLESGFHGEYLEEIERMHRLLKPEVRSPEMVEMYWELAGEDQYSSENEMALVGQMADYADLSINDKTVKIEIFVAY